MTNALSSFLCLVKTGKGKNASFSRDPNRVGKGLLGGTEYEAAPISSEGCSPGLRGQYLLSLIHLEHDPGGYWSPPGPGRAPWRHVGFSRTRVAVVGDVDSYVSSISQRQETPLQKESIV